MTSDESRLESMVLLSRGLLHDVNNSLAPVMAYPSLLKDKIQDPRLLEMVEDLEQGAKATAELVRHLQIVLRCAPHFQEESFDLRDLLEALVASNPLQRLLEDHPGMKIIHQKSGQALPVLASRSHVRQAVFLLLRQTVLAYATGSRFALSCGESSIRKATWDTSLKSGRYAVLQIRPCGRRTQEENLPGKTVQLERSFALGIVHDLGGSIHEYSDAQGPVTAIYLPIQAVEKAVAIEEGPPTLNSNKPKGRKTILVVDDLWNQRRLTSLLLEDLGYHAVSIGSGEAALQYLEQHGDVALMLLDMNMGSAMDGYDTLEHALELRPGLRCVLVSAFTGSKRARMALALGAQGPLEKPFRIVDLQRMVNQVLSEE